MEAKNKIIRVYFSSGKAMDISYSQEKLEKVLEVLKRTWTNSFLVDDHFRVNFSHVTHYEVRDG